MKISIVSLIFFAQLLSVSCAHQSGDLDVERRVLEDGACQERRSIYRDGAEFTGWSHGSWSQVPCSRREEEGNRPFPQLHGLLLLPH